MVGYAYICFGKERKVGILLTMTIADCSTTYLFKVKGGIATNTGWFK
jgi:hypothetical protein